MAIESLIRHYKSLLLGIFALILISLVTLYIYSDDIFQSFQDPGEPFQTYQKPTPADYRSANAWMARPDLSVDPYEHETVADVFVIVPTVYKGGEHWNLPVDDTRRIEKLSRITRPNYVDTFSDVGRLFAPYYRQASIYSFLTTREDARRAQDLAYRDVKRSFEFFLENNSPERPIVIVGYNQGALHGTRLLMDYFQGPLAEKLAGAYLLGHPVPLDFFESELKLTPPCESEIDRGCVVSFGAFYPNDEELAERFTSKLLVRNNQGYKAVYNRDLLCTNPLLWNRSEDYAPIRLHKGGVAAQGLEPNTRPALLTKQAGVQCQSGILLVDKPQNSLFRRPLKFGGKFRTLPSNLFYEDLRVNGLKRVTATIDAGHLPKRVEKLDGLDVIDIVESPVRAVKKGN